MKHVLRGIAQINYVLADFRSKLSEEEIETLRSARYILQRLVKNGNLSQDSDAF